MRLSRRAAIEVASRHVQATQVMREVHRGRSACQSLAGLLESGL